MNKFFLTWFNKILQVPYLGLHQGFLILRLPSTKMFYDPRGWQNFTHIFRNRIVEKKR